MANGSTTTASSTAETTLPMLKGQFKGAYLPKLKQSLIPLDPWLTKNDIVFTDKYAYVQKKSSPPPPDKVIARRDNTGLWRIQEPSIQKSMAGYQRNIQLTSTAERVAFLHGIFGYQPLKTFKNAVEKGYYNFPGVTSKDIEKNPPNNTSEAAGHQRRRPALSQKAKRSMRSNEDRVTPLENESDFTERWTSNMIKLVDVRRELQSQTRHGDLSGAFPITSLGGNKYILLVYSENGNYIHVEPLQSRNAESLQKAYTKAHDFFQSHDIQHKFERLDNEFLFLNKWFKEKFNTEARYVPPHDKAGNMAERMLQTFKGHLISSLAGVDTGFPLKLWDKCLLQVEMTLNLSRPSKSDPSKSAYEYIHGTGWDPLRTPMAPLGTFCTVYEPERTSFGSHGLEGYYIGPAMDHSKCFQIYIPTTNDIRISASINWYPDQFSKSQDDMLLKLAVENLRNTILDLKTPIEDVNLFKQVQELVDMYLPPSKQTTTEQSTSPQRVLEEHNEIESVQNMVRNENHTGQGEENASVQRVEVHPNITVKPSETESFQRVETVNTALLQQTIENHDVQFQRVLEKNSASVQRVSATKSEKDQQSQSTFGEKLYNLVATTCAYSSTIKTTPQPFDGFRKVDMKKDPISEMTHGTFIENPNYREVTKINHPDRDKWIAAFTEEFESYIKSNTMEIVDSIPNHKKKSSRYAAIACRIKQNQSGKLVQRVRIAFGGVNWDKTNNTKADVVDRTTFKIMCNVAVSENANLSGVDISDFYIHTPLKEKEYMKIPINVIPAELIQKYNLDRFYERGYVSVILHKTLWGHPEAGRLSQKKLIKHLNANGYYETNTTMLFRHESRNITFILCVDDFLVKWTNEQDYEHFTGILEQVYPIKKQLVANNYIGFNIDYDKKERKITLSIPEYVQAAITRFKITGKTVRSPGIYTPPSYGKKSQTAFVDDSRKLKLEEIKEYQQMVGVLQYYALMISADILTATNKIAMEQSSPTINNRDAAIRILLYLKGHPDQKVTYFPSSLNILASCDAAYNSESKARSRKGDIFVMGYTGNGLLDYESKVIDRVVTSAYEAEYASLFSTTIRTIILRQTLYDFGYPQLEPTTILCDNETAVNIANERSKQKKSKHIDSSYHYIRDRIKIGDIQVKWIKGTENLADYFTKHLPIHEFERLTKILTSSYPFKKDQKSCSKGVLDNNSHHLGKTNSELPLDQIDDNNIIIIQENNINDLSDLD